MKGDGVTVETIESTSRTAETIIRRIGDGVGAISDRITDRLFEEVPVYAAGAAGSREAVYASVYANVSSAFDRLTGAKFDLAAAAKTGRIRAQQGVPLPDLLTSFRMGYDEAWGTVIEAARRPPAVPSDEVVDLSHSWFRLHNLVGDTLIHAYREEAQHLLLTRSANGPRWSTSCFRTTSAWPRWSRSPRNFGCPSKVRS
ncbi:hypothetical protein GCM10029992_15460 [Glycomyces albus]